MPVESNDASLPGGMVLAPLWRRALAGLIDVLFAVSLLTAVGGTVFAALRARLTSVATVFGHLPGMLTGLGGRLLTPDRPKRLTQMMFAVPAQAYGLRHRNRRTIGARVMGIRRVDLRTGGPVTLRSAVIRQAASAIRSQAVRSLMRAASKRSQGRLREFTPQMRELERKYADDRAAHQRAMMDLYREHDINPAAPVGLSILAMAAAHITPLMFSPLRRRGLIDRLAGTAVVIDRPQDVTESGAGPR